ncbi:hypothetical protein LTR09_004875 [Extremus antarcticus]|uniref:Uncharacterized protein n=1 Tax=Extremus antarcticus TaxID=702011 RepID=A0AAJ0DHQ1_9PEZI|nr:hypothetical protein LTR09_004875 [Extremus antarcticus]
MATFSNYERELHTKHIRHALAEARKSPPKPTNFCVGACLVAMPAELTRPMDDRMDLLATGYTLECEGNTHAEQCCFIKLAAKYECSEDDLGHTMPEDRILKLSNKHGEQAITKVYVGVSEPETFVGVNEGRRKLENAGIKVIHVPGMEEEILAVATAGHEKRGADV